MAVLKVHDGSGFVDLVGGPAHPNPSTDNAIARFDGTTGQLQDSDQTSINDNGEIEFWGVGGREILTLTQNQGGSGNPALTIKKSQGSKASPSGVTAVDDLGDITFQGYDTSTYAAGAVIRVEPTETWSGTAHGTRMLFRTTDNATTLVDTNLIIEEDGNLSLQNNSLEKVGNFAAKGDIMSASAANTPSTLTVGANNAFLMASSGETTGNVWGQRVIAEKTSNEAITEDTDFSDDAALGVAVTSGKKYTFDMLAVFTSNTTADFKYRFTGPTMTLISIGQLAGRDAVQAVFQSHHTTAMSQTKTLGTFGTETQIMTFKGIINPSSTDTLAFQWAQRLSDVGATTVLAGSYMEIREYV